MVMINLILSLEKYQQPQICRWYHPNGRKWRGTKEPLDEGERGEQKAGLKLNIQKTKIMASSPITSWHIEGEKSRNSEGFYFLGLQNHCGWWLQPQNWKTLAPWKESYDKPRQSIKKQRHHFADKGPSSQSYDFSRGCVYMWEVDPKEGWAPKTWCFPIVVLEKTLESSLDSKEIKLVNPKGNPPWIFIGRTDVEAEAPMLWPPDGKSQLIGKDPVAGKDWRQEEKGDRGWDGWMASLTRWTWIWASAGSWWWTGKPGVLQSMESQRVGHNWAIEGQGEKYK